MPRIKDRGRSEGRETKGLGYGSIEKANVARQKLVSRRK
jgi:hypothetical protein